MYRLFDIITDKLTQNPLLIFKKDSKWIMIIICYTQLPVIHYILDVTYVLYLFHWKYNKLYI